MEAPAALPRDEDHVIHGHVVPDDANQIKKCIPSPPGGQSWPAHRCPSIIAVELLRTPRLMLRDWDEADLAAYFDLYSRWEVARWLGSQPRRALTDLDQARAALARWQAVTATHTAPHGLWAIVPQAGTARQGGPGVPGGPGGPVGTVLLLPLSDEAGPTGEVEVGWHLHPDYQGRGFATEAAAALLAAAAQAGMPRVLALTDPDNQASQAVAGRLGMADEGLTGRWYGLTTRQYRWETGI
jgi:RimJ/RimL family protein N-acetyltransferase